MEDSSDGEGYDEAHEGGFNDWGEDDDAPVIPVSEGFVSVDEDVVKGGLGGEFKMKDTGEEKFLLGMDIRRQENGDVLLVQEHYARDVVSRFNMEGCKSVSTPFDLGCQLDSSQQLVSNDDRGEMVDIPYRSAIGSVMYLATCARPDIAAAVSKLSKFSQNLEVAHWEGVIITAVFHLRW